jgi:hypothetical protein
MKTQFIRVWYKTLVEMHKQLKPFKNETLVGYLDRYVRSHSICPHVHKDAPEGTRCEDCQ